jgi:uncharacterized protein
MELTNDFEVSTGVDEAWRVLTDVERIAPCLPGAELREIEGDEYRGVVKVKVGPISAEYRGAAHFVELDEKAHKAVLRAEGREARGQGNASATITALLEPSDKGTKVSVVTDLSISGKVAQFGRGVLADVSANLLGQFVDNLEATVLAQGNEPAAEPSATDEKAGAAAGGKRAPAKSRRRGAAAVGDEGAEAGEEAEKAEHAEGEPATNGKAEADGPSQNGSARSADAASEEGESGATVRRLDPRPAEPVDLFEVAGPSLVKRLVPLVAAAAVLAAVAAVLRRLRS